MSRLLALCSHAELHVLAEPQAWEDLTCVHAFLCAFCFFSSSTGDGLRRQLSRWFMLCEMVCVYSFLSCFLWSAWMTDMGRKRRSISKVNWWCHDQPADSCDGIFSPSSFPFLPPSSGFSLSHIFKNTPWRNRKEKKNISHPDTEAFLQLNARLPALVCFLPKYLIEVGYSTADVAAIKHLFLRSIY